MDHATGAVVWTVPLAADAKDAAASVLAAQREKFIAKFGRDLVPGDPVFFDLDEDELRECTANAMRSVGVRPALIYAYEETDLIVTAENRQRIPTRDLREFDAKVREYDDLHPADDPSLD